MYPEIGRDSLEEEFLSVRSVFRTLFLKNFGRPHERLEIRLWTPEDQTVVMAAWDEGIRGTYVTLQDTSDTRTLHHLAVRQSTEVDLMAYPEGLSHLNYVRFSDIARFNPLRLYLINRTIARANQALDL